MMASHWGLLVLLVQFVRCNGEVNLNSPTPSWGYKCQADVGCQRTDQPIHKENSTLYKSLDLCRTVCGRFGGIWPRPSSITLSAHTVPIHPNYLRFDLVDVPVKARAILEEMTNVMTRNLLAECGGNVTPPSRTIAETPVVVYANVKSANTTLTWATVEHYTMDLQVKDGQVVVKIFAETIYGARHALETLSQLVASDKPDFSDQQKCVLRLVSGAKIVDKPVYKHRSLILDTSRHFIPLSDIKRTLDGMAATKMNVFHWHVTDSHSFPLQSKRVPLLTRFGAYSASEIYSTVEVKQLIHYARVRGIRVVIEIDSPAHAGNGWQWGKDEFLGDLAVCVNSQPWRKFCIQPPCGQLNPANPNMYRVLGDLYKDLAEMLPHPPLLHMGGDEVFFNCWNSNKEILAYMKKKGYRKNSDGFLSLWAEFHKRTLQLWDDQLKALGLPPQPVMLWSSELTQAHKIQKYLHKNRYVIQVWEAQGMPLLRRLLRLGYRVVSVPKNVWYLDHGFWGDTNFTNWQRMYAYAPPNAVRMLGGGVGMWSEYADGTVLDARVWPRAAAVGERLWSNPSTGAAAAEPRLHRLRARLLARGLRPDAIAPAWCAHHDARCL